MGCADNGIGCNGSKKGAKFNLGGINLGSITAVLKIIQTAFALQQKPVTPLPPPLILVGANLRSGLSPRAIASRIIQRQTDAGAPVGDIFNGSDNITEKMEVIRLEEIINAIQTESKVEVVIPPGGAQVSTVGIGNSGIPVISQGANVNIISGVGVIR